MPCPNCSSNYLWDDNLAWGCRECGWMCVDGHIRNYSSSKDTWDKEPPAKKLAPAPASPTGKSKAELQQELLDDAVIIYRL